ncbi:MAG: hypothetical protein QHJ81_00310 [Anaerolineae bacterium]|nr:hypothetical protein [Anaerolineae bacterium]
MRSRGLAIGFLIIVVAACAGAYLALRLINRRLEPSGRTWQPPTLPAAAALSPTAVIGPAATLTPTPIPPSATPTARPRPEDTTPKPTEASPTATPTPAGSYRFLPAGPVRHTAGGCPGQYIMGMVQDAHGNPLPNVRLRSTDPWGNEAFAVTKSSPGELGRYDFPLFPPADTAVTYRLVVLDQAGRPASPEVPVPHHQEGPHKDANCHWLDWQRIE